jgi:S1-C subfamily serine protease
MSYVNRILGGVMVLVLTLSACAWASKLILKDGTTLEGTVIPNGDEYWIKTSDGNTRMIPAANVQEMILDSAPASGDTTASTTVSDSTAYRAALLRASSVSSALAAVAIWQEFIDKYPDNANISDANGELAHWKELANTGAEKINGKWIGGDERKQLIAQADDLTRQGIDMIEQDQTLQAVDKLQQSVKLYPNSFLTNFSLGYIATFQENYDSAVDYYTKAARLKPTAIEAINNLAVVNFIQGRYEISIYGFQQAAEIQDSEPIAQNLYTALAQCPSDIRDMPRMNGVKEASNLLATKYSITQPLKQFGLLHPPPAGAKEAPGVEQPSMVWSGTGFIISEDGLILTNRHVAKGAKTLLVITPTDQASADVVAIDDQYDLALIRIKTKAKLPFVRFSPNDSPSDGADCVVMGYPMLDRLGADVKVTRGIVSSSSSDEGFGADILTDAKVNPGNSGGPILDKYGNVMAIVCMKSVATAMEDSYGIGISAGHIREFLKRNKIDTTPGPTQTAMDTESIVAQIKPATVCILGTK